MRFSPSILGQLFEVVDRRCFQAIVDAHDGDFYVKGFKSWDHLLALVYAQLSGADSLRNLEVSWNANRQHHYHLGSDTLARSTLGMRTRAARLRSLPTSLPCLSSSSGGRRGARAPKWCS